MEREEEIENTARQFVNCRGYWMEQEKKIKYMLDSCIRGIKPTNMRGKSNFLFVSVWCNFNFFIGQNSHFLYGLIPINANVGPFKVSGNFLGYVSAKSPSNISPNPSEAICKVLEP